ncbi:MAG: hypothetical protein ACE5IL_02400 [Myxococcota bacterium]
MNPRPLVPQARMAGRDPMESRPYFILGDLLANGVIGALVGLVCVGLMGPSWNMWLGRWAD